MPQGPTTPATKSPDDGPQFTRPYRCITKDSFSAETPANSIRTADCTSSFVFLRSRPGANHVRYLSNIDPPSQIAPLSGTRCAIWLIQLQPSKGGPTSLKRIAEVAQLVMTACEGPDLGFGGAAPLEPMSIFGLVVASRLNHAIYPDSWTHGLLEMQNGTDVVLGSESDLVART